MAANEKCHSTSYTFTKEGEKFLQLVKDLVNSPYANLCIVDETHCKEAIRHLEAHECKNPEGMFLEIYCTFSHYIEAVIGCEEISKAFKNNTLNKLQEKSEALLKMRDAINLFPASSRNKGKHPFFEFIMLNI